MPTAAKLAAALLFAVVALLAAQAVMAVFPRGMQFGSFATICAVIGALVGWRVMGPRAGKGMRVAAGAGVATSFVVVFWAILFFALNEMLRNSIRTHYDGPLDAVFGVFEIAADYAARLFDPVILAVLLVGGAASGLVVEWVSRRWR